jgi:hypothetical protein
MSVTCHSRQPKTKSGQLFAQYGTVESVNLITDRDTGRPGGFGFVEMSRSEAPRAIQNLDGKSMGGRTLRVNEAQERAGGPKAHGSARSVEPFALTVTRQPGCCFDEIPARSVDRCCHGFALVAGVERLAVTVGHEAPDYDAECAVIRT